GGAPDAPATLYLAVSRGGDPCGTWWAYRLTFTGPLFPPGGRFDRAYLSQDPQALLLSANNVAGSQPARSAAFALPKAAGYAGALVDFPVFLMVFSAAPVTTTAPGEDSFYLAAVPGEGYRLYRMVNSAGPGTFVLDEAWVAAPFEAPPRRV